MEKRNPAVMNDLDEEWMELILTARKLELSIDEVRAFLKHPSNKSGSLEQLIVTGQDLTTSKEPRRIDGGGDGGFIHY